MYYHGYGVAQDYVGAVKWYRLAANQGVALSRFALGAMYYHGRGVPTDYIEAFKWVKLAATGSDKDAAQVREFMESNLKRKMAIFLFGLGWLGMGVVFLVFMA